MSNDHPKCSSCKHFKSEIDDWDNPAKFGCCHLVAESWEMSQWDHETGQNSLKPFFAGHLASVSDGSAYSASLNVHANFYCAMHSEMMPSLNPYSEYTE